MFPAWYNTAVFDTLNGPLKLSPVLNLKTGGDTLLYAFFEEINVLVLNKIKMQFSLGKNKESPCSLGYMQIRQQDKRCLGKLLKPLGIIGFQLLSLGTSSRPER